MTITIPTTELAGLISDALVFAPADKDDSLHGVLVTWDGQHLAAAGYDVLSGGESSWDPDDEAGEDDGDDGDPSIEWGADDDEPAQWSVFLTYPDAKEIVKTFRLAAKFCRTPVYVDIQLTPPRSGPGDEDPAPRLYVTRHRHPWCVAHSMHAQGLSDVSFPDVSVIVEDALIDAQAGTVVADEMDKSGHLSMLFNPARLGQFGMVRPHGLAKVSYLGAERPTIVTVGTRVRGFVFPAGASAATAAERIRHGV